MLTKAERKMLDAHDQTEVICPTCGATLADYRHGEKCTARLDVRCAGFMRVEAMLKPN